MHSFAANYELNFYITIGNNIDMAETKENANQIFRTTYKMWHITHMHASHIIIIGYIISTLAEMMANVFIQYCRTSSHFIKGQFHLPSQRIDYIGMKSEIHERAFFVWEKARYSLVVCFRSAFYAEVQVPSFALESLAKVSAVAAPALVVTKRELDRIHVKSRIKK
jgi:hypothetical protein